MENANSVDYRVERVNRILGCRAHVRPFYYFITGAGSLWLLLGIATLATFGLNNNTIAVIWSAVFGFGLPTLLLLFAQFTLRPIANTRVELKPSSLVIRRYDQESEWFFVDVQSVKLYHIPFVAGWMKLKMKNGTTHYLTVALERSEYVLDALLHFNPELTNPVSAQNYRLTAVYYDHSWARLTDRLNNHRKLFAKYGLGSLFLPIAYFVLVAKEGDAVPNIFKVILLMVGAFVFLLALGISLWFLCETLILSPASRRSLKSSTGKPVRPVEFEKRVELLADFLYLVVAVGCLFAIAQS